MLDHGRRQRHRPPGTRGVRCTRDSSWRRSPGARRALGTFGADSSWTALSRCSWRSRARTTCTRSLARTSLRSHCKPPPVARRGGTLAPRRSAWSFDSDARRWFGSTRPGLTISATTQRDASHRKRGQVSSSPSSGPAPVTMSTSGSALRIRTARRRRPSETSSHATVAAQTTANATNQNNAHTTTNPIETKPSSDEGETGLGRPRITTRFAHPPPATIESSDLSSCLPNGCCRPFGAQHDPTRGIGSCKPE